MNALPSPTLFQRLFLSHLLLLFLCFIAAALVFTHVFAPGIRVFIHHTPLVLLPAVLVLILMAALLASWTTNAIAYQIEEIILTLGKRPVPDDGGKRKRASSVEEIDQLMHVIQSTADAGMTHRMDDALPTELFNVVVDNGFAVLSVNEAAYRLTGLADSPVAGIPFVDIFSIAAAREGAAARLRLLYGETGRIEDFITRVDNGFGTIHTVMWNSVALTAGSDEEAGQLQLIGLLFQNRS